VIVRCGRCQTEFQAPGEGRFACPACGAANEVRTRPAEPDLVTPPPPPEPEAPSPRATCGECGFSFIVGPVAVATCPMCGAEVGVGREGSAS
jgi:Zn finger protein HypA/HybF involved in hydrogenase expression